MNNYDRGYQDGMKEERQSWLQGLHCSNCGGPKPFEETSSMCAKCWEEE